MQSELAPPVSGITPQNRMRLRQVEISITERPEPANKSRNALGGNNTATTREENVPTAAKLAAE